MADETDAGVAYLTALKRSSGTETATAIAAMPAGEPSARHDGSVTAPAIDGDQYGGSEKRRSPRYKCDGSVELMEDGCDVRTWASFTDVSLHGCYVEAQATYPVRTSLHMKMELNGLRLETNGIVRVTYPYLGMGIAFVDMSEENRERLKGLLNTVTYSRVIVGPGVTSIVPTCGPLGTTPEITNPGAAVQALEEFFQTRHLLTRDDFLKLIAKSQGSETKR
jgi:PilZ domain